MTSVLGELVVPKAVTDWLRAALRESDVAESRAREQALQHARQECDRIEQRIETMYLDKLDGRITVAFYDEKAALWRQEQAKLQNRIVELKTATCNFDHAINTLEETSAWCKAFPTQPAVEQRRLLTILVDRAAWKAGELDTTLKAPFQKLRLSNPASLTRHGGNHTAGVKIEEWLLR